jgi:glucose-1-phosphate thymidylyltransferase
VKGVILAGGKGTRLYPMTKIITKHLLPVGQYPMIHYAVMKLKEAGIEDIVLVISQHSAGLYTDFFGSGREWGVRITYRIQDHAGGIAQALSEVEDLFAPGEKLVVLLGDNLFDDSLFPYIRKFEMETGALVFLKEVPDPGRYGVPILKEDQILWIEEKPLTPKSNFAVTGIYMYDASVFEMIRTIRPSDRGELEITDVNNCYALQGKLAYSILQGWWTDAGTHESLLEAGIHLSKVKQKGQE